MNRLLYSIPTGEEGKLGGDVFDQQRHGNDEAEMKRYYDVCPDYASAPSAAGWPIKDASAEGSCLGGQKPPS